MYVPYFVPGDIPLRERKHNRMYVQKAPLLTANDEVKERSYTMGDKGGKKDKDKGKKQKETKKEQKEKKKQDKKPKRTP